MNNCIITLRTGEKISIFGTNSFDKITDDLHDLELITAKSNPNVDYDDVCFRTADVIFIQEILRDIK